MAKAEYRSAVRSRNMIQMALAELLAEKPLEKITVTDIVNRAGISRGTFYAHYNDIPDMLHHLLQQTFSKLREAIADRSSDPAEVAHAFLYRLKGLLQEDLVFYRRIMDSPSAAVLQDQLVGIAVDYFLDEKVFAYPGNPEQYELMIRFCAGGVSNLYREWFSGKLPYTLEQLTETAESMVCRIIRDF